MRSPAARTGGAAGGITEHDTGADELQQLVARLAGADAALQAYGGGAIDSVINPEGQMLLLRQAQQALRRSEEAFRGIVEASVDCVVTADHTGRITEFNPAAERTFGYRREEAIGRLVAELIIPLRYHEAHAAGWARYMQTREERIVGRRMEIEALRADGSEFPVEITVTPLGTQEPPVFSAFIRDLTERRLLEQQQREAEQRFRALIENGWDAISLADAAGKILYCSPAVTRILGFEIDEVVGRVWLEFIHPADHAAVESHLAEALARPGIGLQSNKRVRHKDGSWRAIEGMLTNLLNDGAVGAVVNNFRDVTERKRAAEDLERIFDLSPDMICTSGFDGYFKKLNPAFERTLGYTADELRAVPFLSFVHAADQTATVSGAAALTQGGKLVSFENRYRCKDGSYRWLQWSATPDLDQQLIYAVCRDVTDQRQSAAELRRSELLLRELSDAMPQMVWASGPDGHLDYFNERTVEYTGLKMEQLLRSGWAGVLHPDDEPACLKRWKRSLATGDSFDIEFRLKRASDGSYRWHLGRALPRYENGAIVRWLGTCTDIEDHKMALETLRLSEENLALAQRVSHTGSWEVTMDGDAAVVAHRPLTWSDETFRIFGFEPRSVQMTQGRFFECVHPADRAEVMRAVTEMARTTGNLSTDHRIVLPDGRERLVHEEATLIRSEGGTAPKIIGSVQDITERRHAEDLLRQQAEMLNLAHDAIIVRELESEKVLFWNSGAERLYGWTAGEAVGQSVRDLIRTDPEELQPALETLAASGEFRGEVHHITKDRREVIVNVRATLVHDAHGKPRSVLTIGSDITEHKKLESQFLRAQRLESIGTLASGVAHDLNNILAPILMSAPLLRENPSAPLMEKIISTIEESAERGAQIVKQVLTFARGVEGERVLVDPSHLVREMVGIAQETFPKSLRIGARCAEDVWPVEGDPTQLHQVLLNLSVNARDAMPNGGTLMLSVENFVVDEHYATMMPGAKAGPHVLIRATDTGTGIPRSLVDKIFDPFFTTKDIGKGTGLGLSTVLGIVKSHGGFLSVYSEVGGGTTFKIFLPTATSAAVKPEVEAPARAMNGNGELIMVVDDEPGIATVTKLILENYNYRVITAADGPEALAVFAQQMGDVQVVITDMMMPYMDGVALIRTLQRMNPLVRFVASTGQGDQARSSELHALGVTACLSKPYNTQKLLGTVQELLGH